jgi:hypothetical protein
MILLFTYTLKHFSISMRLLVIWTANFSFRQDTPQFGRILISKCIRFNNTRKPSWREWIDSNIIDNAWKRLRSQKPSFCENKTIILSWFWNVATEFTPQEKLPQLMIGKLYSKAPFTYAWSKTFLANSNLYVKLRTSSNLHRRNQKINSTDRETLNVLKTLL